MNIKLFNKKYWVRRFEEQKEIKGYLTSSHNDFVVELNVHPSGSDTVQALPEGARYVKKIEGHGNCNLIASDTKANVKGDLLYYDGRWYECISSQYWNHTILSHYNYLFVLVPLDGSRENDLTDVLYDLSDNEKAGESLW